ncbi:MAG: IS982 family transposase, partial [Hormoscilla sp. GM102CHS1]|nr:IS982 family transposase [Hormoscilla sp. GM102CHS1]MBC6473733.1 IS982 family transposase [Hormoscilla sp. GM102CHS1]
MFLFQVRAQTFNELNPGQEYILDSFPVPVCDNIRIDRCQIYNKEEYRGYIASK